jgi:tetratricopeptide (TPR) repeat protein
MDTGTTATTAITATGLAKSPREARGGVLLIPLESRAIRTLAVSATLLAVAALAAAIVRPAVADFIAERATRITDVEHALGWDPGDPGLHLRLGHAYRNASDYDRARQHFETARRLRPTDAYPWLNLALLADNERDLPRARQAIGAALRLAPHDVSIRWEAGLLHFRWGDRDPALEHFRYVLAVDPRQRDAAFQLARLLLRPGGDPATLLPDDPDGLTNVLLAALRHEDAALAQVAWLKRAPLQPALEEKFARRYLDFLLEAGDGPMARRVWQTLVAPDGQADGNPVWNAGFETERLLGWGLDWRIRRVWGVEAGLDRFTAAKGTRSLRLTFNSFPSLDFAGVSQAVAVQPGREYRVRALARAADFTTRSGLKIQVVRPGIVEQFLAETPTISGTTGWLRLETPVTIPPDVSLVLLRLRREPAREPEGNLGGKVWLDEVSLQ